MYNVMWVKNFWITRQTLYQWSLSYTLLSHLLDYSYVQKVCNRELDGKIANGRQITVVVLSLHVSFESIICNANNETWLGQRMALDKGQSDGGATGRCSELIVWVKWQMNECWKRLEKADACAELHWLEMHAYTTQPVYRVGRSTYSEMKKWAQNRNNWTASTNHSDDWYKKNKPLGNLRVYIRAVLKVLLSTVFTELYFKPDYLLFGKNEFSVIIYM